MLWVTWQLPALFLTCFGAATLLPGGSEAALLALSASGDYSNLVLLTVASLGNSLGSVVNYWLGRLALHYRHHRFFPVNSKQLDKAQEWFSRWGQYSLLLSWAPVIGDPITVAAGVMRYNFLKFCILVTIAKTLRYMIILGLFQQFWL